jgi:hypothetical protein
MDYFQVAQRIKIFELYNAWIFSSLLKFLAFKNHLWFLVFHILP